MNYFHHTIIYISMFVLPAICMAQEIPTSGPNFAPPVNSGIESDYSAQFEFTSRTMKDAPSTAKLYVERSVSNNVSAWVEIYYDRYYSSITIGVAKKIDDLQLGIGIGRARYNARTAAFVNPWLFYKDESGLELSIEGERYSGKQYLPSYMRGYAFQNLGGHFSIGAYAESNYGLGLLGVFAITTGVRAFVTARSQRLIGGVWTDF